MTRIKTASFAICAALATTIVAPAQAAQGVRDPENGRFDVSQSCDDRYRNFRHTDNDGHDHTMGPEHAGHHHGEKTRNFKGYKLDPHCPTKLMPAERAAPGLGDAS